MTQNYATHLALIEGSKDQRDKYINNVQVLNKIKKLITLPNTEFATVQSVINYYEVDEGAVKMLIHRHKGELVSDGLKTVQGEELSNIKLLSGIKNRGRHLTLISKRAVLRIGMLLSESPVAEKVRTYLLNVEEQSNEDQKNNAFKSLKWDEAKDELLINTVTAFVYTEKTLQQAFNKVSELTGFSKNKIHGRWYQNLKEKCDSKTLELISSNRGSVLKKDETVESATSVSNFTPLLEMKSWFENSMTHQIKEITENLHHKEAEWISRNQELISKLDTKTVEIDYLKSKIAQSEQLIESYQESIKMKDEMVVQRDKRNNKLTKELTDLKKRIEAISLLTDKRTSAKETNGRMDVKRPKTAFKMDKNGNLDKM
ncbi:hypothetical protein ABE354_23560 [Brevibacillus laterosporus]|uniref:hypothetical protein n=1 Tax=Brevibacillus laterosporus TaxID=1465 RepID=UPI003D1BCA6F